VKQLNNGTIKLKIADIVIKLQSKFYLKPLDFKKSTDFRFRNFLYKGRKDPEIIIAVQIVKKLPRFPDAKTIFITYHFQDGSENWRLLKWKDYFIYISPLNDKKQVMVVNRDFNMVKAYLLSKDKDHRAVDGKEEEIARKYKGLYWDVSDIVYDFLQVLLINYLAITKKDGVFTHSMGIKDSDEQGLMFMGKSGAGKTTLAKLYHKYSKAMILNDDRVIIRKINKIFYIYGSLWHGDFSDYLDSRIEKAKLKKLFFLRKAKENLIRPVSLDQAFKLIYPAMFPTFWDKGGTETIVLFLSDLLSKISCFRLKFRKDKSVIGFVRGINC